MDHLLRILGDPVTDPEEEVFAVFSESVPSQSLGFVDSHADEVVITVGGRDLTIRQSRGLLTSDRKLGTTGAVVWKVTPLFAEWLASPNPLSQAGFLSSDSVVIELGAGVAGIVASTLAPKIQKYIATDQGYVLDLLEQNISANLPPPPRTASKKQSSKKKASQPGTELRASNIEVYELDWETDSVSLVPMLLPKSHEDMGVDLVIACDCIYNEALTEPFNEMCAQICNLRLTNNPPTFCLVAQQRRAPDVFEAWLKSFNRLFHVWRVPDSMLTAELRENSGFMVHLGMIRQEDD